MVQEKLSRVAKVIELVGVSNEGWEDAAKRAVKDASKTLDNITGVEIINYTGTVKDGLVIEYKANVRIAFGLTDR